MTDTTDIAALREAALKATPGNWKLGIGSTYAFVQAAIDMKLGGRSWVKLCHVGRAGWRNQQSTIDDARFIALANPVAILAILDQLDVINKSEWNLAGDLVDAHNLLGAERQQRQAAEKERDDLKSAHSDMVSRCALLRQRTDLPADRIPAYNALVKAQEKIAELREKLANPVVLSDCTFEAVSHMAHWYSEGECVAWVSGAEHVKKQIVAAGFSVREE